MKLNLICEDENIISIERSIMSLINEGTFGSMDDAIESVGKAASSIPGLGGFGGSFPLVVKNLMQDDHLGAAIYLVSMDPSKVGTTIATTLRSIQNLAKSTGQEERLNRWIGWILDKLGANPKPVVMKLFDTAKTVVIDGITKKLEGLPGNADLFNKFLKLIDDNSENMSEALDKFMDLIINKGQKIQPIGGSDMPGEYVDDLSSEIKMTYNRLRDKDIINGTREAIKYKNKVMGNTKSKPEVKMAYEKVFGPISEI